MRLGYLIHRFPALSETFISREVTALERIGADVALYSFERPPEADIALFTPEARTLLARTQYISRGEAVAALASMAVPRMLVRNAELSRTATVKTSALLRLGRAAALLRRARQDGATHLHAHWPYGTGIAHLISGASDISYSISVHAHEVAHESGHFPAVFETLRFASFCNAAAMNYLLDRLPASAREKAKLIYHGIDLDRFPFAASSAPAKSLRIISAGRLAVSKGFGRLIVACARAREAGIDVELTILGRGSGMADLQAFASQCGFADHLKMPGWVAHSSVSAHIHAHHAFALLASTDYNDGLPNVVLEAMACGRPVIVSPFPAAREAINDGVNGFILSDVGDYAGFAAALKQLEDVSRVESMGMEARKSVMATHDSSVHIASLFELLKESAAG